MKRKDFTPIIMWCILFVVILILAFIRFNRNFNVLDKSLLYFDNIFISLYLIWMIIELRVSKKDINTDGKKTSDFMTCQVYGLGQALTILTALWFPSIWMMQGIFHIVGVIIFIFGICYRLWAIFTLGQFYSHRVRITDQHKIVVSGPYRFTRHPAYAGMIFAHIGICIYFFNWITICVFLFILLPAIFLRIVIEEKTLLNIDGYSDFAKKRKRLFPGLW